MKRVGANYPYTLKNAEVEYSQYSVGLTFNDDKFIIITDNGYLETFLDSGKEIEIINLTDTSQIEKNTIYDWKHGDKFQLIIFREEAEEFLKNWDAWIAKYNDPDPDRLVLQSKLEARMKLDAKKNQSRL